MAQSYQIPRITHHSPHCHISALHSTALVTPILDVRQQVTHLQSPASSFYRSSDSVELLKSHDRVFPYERVQRVIESQSSVTDQFCSQIGSKSRSFEFRGSHVSMSRSRIFRSRHSGDLDGRLVCLQALPRPVSFLPAAGPIRDFLFATIGAVFAFLFAGILARIWCLEERYFRATAAERGTASMPEMGSNPGQKESVEWVNMVIHKIWKVYRRSLEVWLVQLLQPAIDNLGKPDYVKRVQIAELNLDYEPLIVRNVQRRASRRANDLQYHFGLRYTGGARCLLNLKLGRAGMETSIPVGVYDLDVDGELWVKLRLAPVKPYVGTLSLAFVRLPTIKLVLAPFRVVNLFSIPFLSNFLSKLLTVDLPRLLVLPRHITFDFLPQGQNVMDSVEAMEASLESGAMDESIASGVLDLLKTGSTEPSVPRAEPSEAFVGELSVTVCDARDLPIRGFTGWSNPYCILALGDQVVESKRNKDTSHPAGHKDPVWNQDFLFLVEDPVRQKLMLRVRDSTLTLNPNIGYVQINLAELKDCVPRTLWLNLKRDGPFGPKKVPGRVRLALTYKSYVDEDDDVTGDEDGSFAPYIKVYGDSGAESVEDIGVSLGEEIAASLMEEGKDGEVKSIEDVEVVTTERKDASVQVRLSPKTPVKNAKSHEQNGSATGGSRGLNGAASGAQLGGNHPLDYSAQKNNDLGRVLQQENGAILRGDQHARSPSTNGSGTKITMNGNSGLKSSSYEGDVRFPRAVDSGSAVGWKDSNGSSKRGGPETYVGNRVGKRDTVDSDSNTARGWNGLSQAVSKQHHEGSAGQLTATVPDSSISELHKEAFRLQNEAELGLEEETPQQVSKSEGNPKLLWLCLFTTVAYILGCSLHISNPLHP